MRQRRKNGCIRVGKGGGGPHVNGKGQKTRKPLGGETEKQIQSHKLRREKERLKALPEPGVRLNFPQTRRAGMKERENSRANDFFMIWQTHGSALRGEKKIPTPLRNRKRVTH